MNGSFIVWFSIVSNYRQDRTFKLNGSDLIFKSIIQPTFSALKLTELTCGRPYYQEAMDTYMLKIIWTTFESL